MPLTHTATEAGQPAVANPSPRAPGQQPDGVRHARLGRDFVWRELREFLAVITLMFALGAAGYALFLAQLQGAIG